MVTVCAQDQNTAMTQIKHWTLGPDSQGVRACRASA